MILKWQHVLNNQVFFPKTIEIKNQKRERGNFDKYDKSHVAFDSQSWNKKLGRRRKNVILSEDQGMSDIVLKKFEAKYMKRQSSIQKVKKILSRK